MTTWSIMAFDPQLDPTRLASDCAEWGLDRVVLPQDFVRDDRFLAALQARGLAPWLNLQVFHAPEHLQAHPDQYARTADGAPAINGWLHMACPSSHEFLEARRSLFSALLDRVRPAVLSFDFLRFHVYWEAVRLDGDPAAVRDGCYCPRCLASFARSAGERPVRGTDGRIAPEQWPAWAAWKVERIGAVAAELVSLARARAAEVPLFVKTVPWNPGELADGLRRVTGQDVEALARLTDGAIPMAFAHLLGRDLAWKRRLLDDVARRTGRPVPSYVQVDAIGDGSLPLSHFEEELAAVQAEGREPIVFQYEQLAKDPARAAVLRRYARERGRSAG